MWRGRPRPRKAARAPDFYVASRFGLNNVVEGSLSPLHYYEVTNAQHLDSFNQFPGYNALLIPLHRYFIEAMDLMYDHLRNGRSLPPSQVVHTTRVGQVRLLLRRPTCRRSPTSRRRMCRSPLRAVGEESGLTEIPLLRPAAPYRCASEPRDRFVAR